MLDIKILMYVRKLMLSQTFWHIVMFIAAVLVAVAAFGSFYSNKKETERKDREATVNRENDKKKIAELQEELRIIKADTSSIFKINQEMYKILLQSSEGPHEEWNSIELLQVAPWFDGRGIDYIYLTVRASSGIITGELRIKDSDEIHPFSTQANATLPLAVRNLRLSEKGHFFYSPIIEYNIKEKTDSNAVLSIVMVGVHSVGEYGVINLERPVEMEGK